MGTNRLEAFSDGVIAIMVLELKIPHGHKLAQALGSDWKGKISPVLYLLGMALAFFNPWTSGALYVAVALIWLVPDPRIERMLTHHNMER